MKKILIYVLFCCLTLSTAFAEVEVSTVQDMPVEHVSTPHGESIDIRIPQKEKIETYKNDKHFQYDDVNKEIAYPTWLLKIMDALSRFFGKTFETLFTREFLIFLLLLLILGLVVLLVLRSQDMKFRDLFRRKKLEIQATDFVAEDINDINFDRLIAENTKQKNYRLAVRYLYLKNLKTLSDSSFICWNANKTNYSYSYEIQSEALRTRFVELTRVFDFVWYGEFVLDEQSFGLAYTRFDDFNQMIEDEG